MQTSQKSKRRIGLLRWVARVWSILALLFAVVLLISILLADTSDLTGFYWVLFGLWFAAVLGVAAGWRWELGGPIVAITALVSREMVYYFLSGRILVDFWIVWLPVLPPAMLFIFIYRKEHPRRSEDDQYPGYGW